MAGVGGISAKNAQIRTGSGTVLEAAEWSVAAEVGEIDDSNFEDAGFARRTGGLADATVNIKAFWNPTSNQHSSPLNLYPGATMTTTSLYLNSTTGKSWSFPILLILSMNETAVVREGIRYDITAKNVGPFSVPT